MVMTVGRFSPNFSHSALLKIILEFYFQSTIFFFFIDLDFMKKNTLKTNSDPFWEIGNLGSIILCFLGSLCSF